MKKAFALTIALIMVFTLVACGSSEPVATEAPAVKVPAATETVTDTNGDGAVKVFLVSPLIGGSAWGNCQKGFEARCAELGWEGTYLGPVTTANTTEMVELVEMAISNGADIIIGNWNDQEAFNDAVDRALEKGITLLGINYALPGRVENYCGIDPVQLGYVQAETLVSNIPEGEPINVVYMQSRLNSQSHNINYASFCEKLAELRPDAVVISQEESETNTQVAYDKLSAILLAHPETNAFVADDGIAAVAAATLVEERNMADTFYVQGIDGGPEILNYVISGHADCTVIQDWLSVGTTAVDLAKTLYEGGTVDSFTGLGAYALYADGVEAYAEAEGIDLG